RSSVIPSAKYCWSGSLPRLAKGSTTIDKRGASRGCAVDVAVATAGVPEDFGIGQSHHALTATTNTAPAATATAATVARRRGGATIGMLDAGRSAMVSGRNA